jgi:hypothetical protein
MFGCDGKLYKESMNGEEERQVNIKSLGEEAGIHKGLYLLY